MRSLAEAAVSQKKIPTPISKTAATAVAMRSIRGTFLNCLMTAAQHIRIHVQFWFAKRPRSSITADSPAESFPANLIGFWSVMACAPRAFCAA